GKAAGGKGGGAADNGDGAAAGNGDGSGDGAAAAGAAASGDGTAADGAAAPANGTETSADYELASSPAGTDTRLAGELILAALAGLTGLGLLFGFGKRSRPRSSTTTTH
ncbi:hypothetical protein Q5424_01910, partial [Conexibacter sp. JD483]|uniref:hypothetical protein n=3 Tax=Conexibacter TaxID=191494 RepID=UPI0028704D99